MPQQPRPGAGSDTVDATPVKSFFVSMLTRDITLEDAILDLLDNCVDGIRRTRMSSSPNKPYKGRWARICYDGGMFSISDNCGGIPWRLRDYAFRMGKPTGANAAAPGGVGVYGIGMKRAIFKMGESCSVTTQNEGETYRVNIDPEWLGNDSDWRIPVATVRRQFEEDGTTVEVSDLHPSIASRFGEDAEEFTKGLRDMVERQYAFIIDKGLRITINKKPLAPKPTRLIYARGQGEPGTRLIRPFFFTAEHEGVSVFLAVGFTRPIPSPEEIASEQADTRYSSLEAGWTVVCNDRAVIYCDRTEVTGWGESGVPRYHTQFIAISGLVEFHADDPSKLPTTTTKRGVDAGSRLYLRVKNKMREGMRVFTRFTYHWKGKAEAAKAHIGLGEPMSLVQLKREARDLPMTSTRRQALPGKQYKPQLPRPPEREPRQRKIAYLRNIEDIKAVAEHLFGDDATPPSTVGAKCFDLALEEASE